MRIDAFPHEEQTKNHVVDAALVAAAAGGGAGSGAGSRAAAAAATAQVEVLPGERGDDCFPLSTLAVGVPLFTAIWMRNMFRVGL